MKKLVLFMVLLLVVMTAYAGGQQEAPAAQEVEYVIDPPAVETDIDIIGWTMPITDFYRDEFESLNEIPNLNINVQFLNGPSAQEQVRLALSGNKKSPYEIVHAANSQISEWGFPGWLMPLDDLVEKYWDEYDLGDIPESAWNAAKVNGQIVGVPAVGNSFQLIYRADLFDKYGIAVPKTYDEVIAAAKTLKEKDDTIDVPFVMNLHAGWAWEYEFMAMLRGFGGKLVNDDNTPAFNGEAGVKAVEMMKRLAEVMGPEGMSYSIDDTEIGLQTGRVAFSNTWASRAVNMKNPEKSVFYEELEFAPSPAPVPGGPLGATAWNDFYCIPKNIEVDPELVFKVIMETVDLESQLKAVEFGITTRMKTSSSDKAGPYLEASMISLEKGVGAYPNTPVVPLLTSALSEALPLATTGDYTAQEVLDRAAANYLEEAKANGFVK